MPIFGGMNNEELIIYPKGKVKDFPLNLTIPKENQMIQIAIDPLSLYLTQGTVAGIDSQNRNKFPFRLL